MSTSTSSARYTDLYNYTQTAEQIDNDLIAQADRLINRLNHFEATCREPGFQVGSDGLGSALRSHATRALPIDQQVRRVGQAFERADRSPWWRVMPPRRIYLPGDLVFIPPPPPRYIVAPMPIRGPVVSDPDLVLRPAVEPIRVFFPSIPLRRPGDPILTRIPWFPDPERTWYFYPPWKLPRIVVRIPRLFPPWWWFFRPPWIVRPPWRPWPIFHILPVLPPPSWLRRIISPERPRRFPLPWPRRYPMPRPELDRPVYAFAPDSNKQTISDWLGSGSDAVNVIDKVVSRGGGSLPVWLDSVNVVVEGVGVAAGASDVAAKHAAWRQAMMNHSMDSLEVREAYQAYLDADLSANTPDSLVLALKREGMWDDVLVEYQRYKERGDPFAFITDFFKPPPAY